MLLRAVCLVRAIVIDDVSVLCFALSGEFLWESRMRDDARTIKIPAKREGGGWYLIITNMHSKVF